MTNLEAAVIGLCALAGVLHGIAWALEKVSK